MKSQKLPLLLATIFCILFVTTYLYNVNLIKQLQRFQKIAKAYELYVSDSKDFSKYIEDNNLKELTYLVEKQIKSQVRTKIDMAKLAFRSGNYAETVDLLREIKDIENPWLDEVYFYLGSALYKIGKSESAKFYLSSFLDNFKYSIYRKEALVMLHKISDGDLKEKVEEILNKMEKSKE
jgi:lipopolysaccharide biosynthesis regulator YciM